jgi:hypothetical protein
LRYTLVAQTAATVILAATLLAPKPCLACFSAPAQHGIDPDEERLDHTPPGPVTVLSAEIIRRGRGEQWEGGCTWSSTSVDGAGILRIELVPPEDDRTPPEMIGYRLEVLDGDVPPDLLPGYDVLADEGVIILIWGDGASDDQESLDFRLSIRAIDLGGNVGSDVEEMEFRHPGTSGCTHTGTAYWGPVLLLVLLPFLRHRYAPACGM